MINFLSPSSLAAKQRTDLIHNLLASVCATHCFTLNGIRSINAANLGGSS